MPKTKDPAILERNAQRIYGCSLADALRLNGGEPLRKVGSRASIYAAQRGKAAHRGIGWEITFPQWLAVWDESGLWAKRGVGKNGYCMARNGDTGPYRVDNVSIQSAVQNSRDGIRIAHASLAAKGWPTRANLLGASPVEGHGVTHGRDADFFCPKTES